MSGQENSADEGRRAPARGSGGLFSAESGSLYVHLQAENGVAHRTIRISPGRVRLLRSVLSWWGGALLLALGGSWVYFALQSVRVPVLTQRVADLQAQLARVDTLGARLRDLQQRYDQVQRMLGVVPTDSGASAPAPVRDGRIPQER